MLVRITKFCEMGCSHCLIDANEQGAHMDMPTLGQTILFLNRVNPRVILITGGEPFSHPHIFEIIKVFKAIANRVLITTNGMPLRDASFRKQAIASGANIQIVNDPKYYPIPIKFEEPELEVINYVAAPIFPAGRALTNHLECTANVPSCANLRLIALQMKIKNPELTLSQIIHMLETHGKLCTPIIDVDGSIRLGETNLCCSAGTIWDEPNILANNVLKVMCNNCGLFNNVHQWASKATVTSE